MNKARLRCVLDQGAILPKMYQWDDAISVFCRKENFAFLSDRFGYLNKFSRINAAAISEGRFPLGNFSKSFSDIMRERAEEIYNLCKARNIRCVVLWSGGCDSTAVISAFLSVCDDVSFLKVLHTKSSVLENSEFYDFMHKNHIETEIENTFSIFNIALEYAKSGHIVVYGFPADQLFGSIIGQNYKGDTTKETWYKFLSNKDNAIQQYEEAFRFYNLPIKTIAEFLWFNNFALKWDYVCNWSVVSEHDTDENIISFFDTYDFECWSVSNFDILHRYDQKNIQTYKLEMKKFIYSVIGMEYIFHMKKIPSISYAYDIDSVNIPFTQNAISAIDDCGIIHTVKFPEIKGPYSSNIVGKYATTIMRKFLKR